MTTALRPTLARCLWTAPLFAVVAVLVTIAARATFNMQPVIQETDRKSTRLSSSHTDISRMPSSA